jgi:hypothetical protein
LPSVLPVTTRGILGWDIGVLVFLLLGAELFALKAAINSLAWTSIPVTIPAWRARHSDWLIAYVEPCSTASRSRVVSA